MIKKLGLVLYCPRESAFRVLVHFSGRLRLCTSHTYLSRSVGTCRYIKTKKRLSGCVLNEGTQSLPCGRAAPVAGRAAAAVDLCDGCAQKLWIRWSVIAHACKNCVRVLCRTQKKEHGSTQAMTVLCNKITRARWPLGREDACVLTVTKEPCSRAALLHHDRVEVDS